MSNNLGVALGQNTSGNYFGNYYVWPQCTYLARCPGCGRCLHCGHTPNYPVTFPSIGGTTTFTPTTPPGGISVY